MSSGGNPRDGASSYSSRRAFGPPGENDGEMEVTYAGTRRVEVIKPANVYSSKHIIRAVEEFISINQRRALFSAYTQG